VVVAVLPIELLRTLRNSDNSERLLLEITQICLSAALIPPRWFDRISLYPLIGFVCREQDTCVTSEAGQRLPP
jgi:hypothetical protein